VRILQVRAEDVRIVWPEVRDYLNGAVQRVGHLYDVGDVLKEIESNIAALLVAEENGKIYGAATIKIVQYPKAKVATVGFLGGVKMRRWIGKIIKAIDIYGKENGCRYTDTIGRRGWIKVWAGKEKGIWVVREI